MLDLVNESKECKLAVVCINVRKCSCSSDQRKGNVVKIKEHLNEMVGYSFKDLKFEYNHENI